MDFFLNMTLLNLQMAAMYGVLALGVYITYSILDFPDLSVDGTVPLGGVVSAMLILKGVNPWLALLAAFAAGAAAGCVTGLLHVKLKIRPLLCGILVMTALLSVNLMPMKAATGGMSIATFSESEVLFNAAPMSLLPDEKLGRYSIRPLITLLALAIGCKYLSGLGICPPNPACCCGPRAATPSTSPCFPAIPAFPRSWGLPWAMASRLWPAR